MTTNLNMKISVALGGDDAEVFSVENPGVSTDYDPQFVVTAEDGSATTVNVLSIEEDTVVVRIDGKVISVPFVADGNGNYKLGHDLIPVDAVAVDHRSAHYSAGGMDAEEGAVSVNMPGKVVNILVSEGDAIEQGQGVIIVEAMKMENELKAGKSGVIAKINVAEGDTVESGAVLIEIGDA